MSLPENLKFHRKQLGLSQAQLASLLNIERSTYTYYEIARSTPTYETLIKIAKIFGVSTDELLGVKEDSSIMKTDMVFAEPEPSFDHSAPSTPAQNAAAASVTFSLEEKLLILKYRQLSENKKKEVAQQIEEKLDEK